MDATCIQYLKVHTVNRRAKQTMYLQVIFSKPIVNSYSIFAYH